MVFIAERLQQDFLHVLFTGLLDEVSAEGKFNGSSAQDAVGELQHDIWAFNDNADYTGFQLFVLKKYFADGFFIKIFDALISCESNFA